ncbi:MAG TPA: glycosyltransferase family 39 protein [Candidatus Kapabacteria bacterium]
MTILSLPEKRSSSALLLVIAVLSGMITCIPPAIIGTGTSALTLASLEHWRIGPPDAFTALHVYWFCVPRVIAFLTGDAFSALVIFRAIVVALSVWLFALTARRLFDTRRAIFASAMLALNVTILFLSHTFGTELMTLLAASVLLYLFTSPVPRHHRIAAILFGLSLSIGFWPFVLMMAIVTVALNIHHTRYTLRSKETLRLFGLMLLGIASYLVLEIFYLGTAHLWHAINPQFFPPRYTNRIAEGIIVAIFSTNVLLAGLFQRKKGSPKIGIARDFQAAFLILGLFFIANTFSREDFLQDVVIFVPCLILVSIERMEKLPMIAGIYFAWNLGMFFLLPIFSADPQLGLADARRVHSTDAIALAYYESSDLMSYAKLRDEHALETEARELLAKEPLDSTLVLLTPNTDAAFDAGTLAAEFPSRQFGWFYGQPINQVRIDGITDTLLMRRNDTLLYYAGLFDKPFAREFIDNALLPGTRLDESEHFQSIDTRRNDSQSRKLIDRMIYLEYQGFHHR